MTRRRAVLSAPDLSSQNARQRPPKLFKRRGRARVPDLALVQCLPAAQSCHQRLRNKVWVASRVSAKLGIANLVSRFAIPKSGHAMRETTVCVQRNKRQSHTWQYTAFLSQMSPDCLPLLVRCFWLLVFKLLTFSFVLEKKIKEINIVP